MAADIAKAGDYLTVTINKTPLIIMRDSELNINAFANICLHRMMSLLQGCGNSKVLKCPYHGWCYNDKGMLIGTPEMVENAHFQKKHKRLKQYKVALWQGWVYVSLHHNPKPLHDKVAPLHDIAKPYGMEHYIPIARSQFQWHTNWKIICENFMESYHLPIVHAATVGDDFALKSAALSDAQYDDVAYQFFSKKPHAPYGVAHPNNTRLKGEWRQKSVLANVFPTHMFVLAPDHCWYLSVLPKTSGTCDIIFGVSVPPEIYSELQHNPKQKEQMMRFFDTVNNEDEEITVTIFRNMLSDAAMGGNLSWMERSIYDFTCYLSRNLPKK